MPRFRLALAASAILLGAVSAASAADLPGPAPMPPPQAPATYIPVAPVFSWTGFYLGANAGYGWSNASGNMTTFGIGADSFTASGDSFVGGGQLGYNYQFGGGFVLGVEGDFQGSFGSGRLSDPSGTLSATVKDPWFGTVRGRLGYAWDRVLLYGTGGLVYGDGTANGTSAGAAFNNSATYWTWTAGAGAEWAFSGPWSAKAEYLYAGSPSSIPAIPNITPPTGSAHTNLIRAGINYHF